MKRPGETVARTGGAYLGEASPIRRPLSDLAHAVLHRPRTAGGVAWAWLTGKRLRARQRLAALVGIDHRLALPPSAMPPAFEPAGEAHPFHVVGVEALIPGAGARIANAFAADPHLQALYGDGLVQARPGGPVYPRLAPAFDPDLLMAVNYLGALVLRPGALPTPLPDDPVDAALRTAERHGVTSIGHLPGFLSGCITETDDRLTTRLDAVRAHLDRTGRMDATAMPEADGRIVVSHSLSEAPLVSVIVPTRDRLDLLRPCLAALRSRTAWPALEVLVCDNGSREPETLAFLEGFVREGRGVVVPYPGPFNFAAMNNAAARQARGRLLVFMNNDVEAFRPDWLVAMARHALRLKVGAVGAKLLDGAGRIQHGGIVLGTGGLVTHAHRHFPGDARGYLSTLRSAHRVSAVTAACLMIEADKFRRVDGFDAETFAVDFNDVDLCLRLNAAGLVTMMEPGAVLHHREAASRRWTDESAARHGREVEAFKKRWGPLLAQDPHYNPGFDAALSTHARLAPPIRPAATARRPG